MLGSNPAYSYCVNKLPVVCQLELLTPKIKSGDCKIYECYVREKKADDSTAKDSLCPKPLTLYDQHLQDMAECAYQRSQNPVEKGLINAKFAPAYLDKQNTTFGVPTKFGESAKETLNPSKSAEQVAAEALHGHEMYKITHGDYYPSEQVSRRYCCPSYDSNMTFGEKTSCDLEGKKTKRLLQPLLEENNSVKYSSCRLNKYLDKYAYQLGKTRDPLKDSICLPLMHSFGKPSVHDKYNLGDLLHYRNDNNLLKGKSRLRSKIAEVRSHLKRANMNNFDNAKQAFQFYDKKNLGAIDAESLKETCLQFNIQLTHEELQELIKDCKQTNYVNNYDWELKKACGCPCQEGNSRINRGCNNNDGIGGLEIANKDERKCSCQFCGRYFYKCCDDGSHNCECGSCGGCSCSCCNTKKYTECVAKKCCTTKIKEPINGVVSLEEFVNFLTYSVYDFSLSDKCKEGVKLSRLVKQIDYRGSDHSRTSQEINSRFGDVDTRNMKTFGVQSELVKSLTNEVKNEDLVAAIKRVDGVRPLLNPSPFTLYGLTNEDVFKPRCKDEIRCIFSRDVERMEEMEFDRLYDEASRGSPCKMACVNSFLQVLDKPMNYTCQDLIGDY